MADYMNPFAGSLAPESVPNNPFWSGVNTAQNQARMAPFVQMEQQRQQLGLEKQGMQNQEFMSSEAQQSRMSAFSTETSENKLKQADADSKLRTMPQAEQLRILDTKNKIMSAEAQPYQELFKAAGDLSVIMDKTPEQARPMVWQQMIGRWQQTHPGAQIPDQFKNYTPELYKQAQDIRNAQVMTPQHAQELEKVRAQGEKTVEAARITGNAHIAAATGAASINERGALAREQLRIQEQSKQNPGQFRVSNRKILNDPKSTDEQKEVAEANLSASLTDDMNRIWQGDGILQSLQLGVMSGTPEQKQVAQQQYDARKNKLYEDRLVQEGIRVRMIPPGGGKPGLVPKRQLKDALQQGFKEVK